MPLINLIHDEILDGRLINIDETNAPGAGRSRPGPDLHLVHVAFPSGRPCAAGADLSVSSHSGRRRREKFSRRLQGICSDRRLQRLWVSRPSGRRAPCRLLGPRAPQIHGSRPRSRKKPQERQRGSGPGHHPAAVRPGKGGPAARIETSGGPCHASGKGAADFGKFPPVAAKTFGPDAAQRVARQGGHLCPEPVGPVDGLPGRPLADSGQQSGRERDPSVCSWPQELAVCRNPQRRRGQRRALQPDRDRQSQQLRTLQLSPPCLRTPAPGINPGRLRSASPLERQSD